MVFLILHVLLQCLDISCNPVFFIIDIETPYQLDLPSRFHFDSWILDSGLHWRGGSTRNSSISGTAQLFLALTKGPSSYCRVL